MNEFENQEVVEVENDQVENPQVQEDTFQATENEPEVVEEVQSEESDVSEEPSEFDALQIQFNELQTSYNELQSNYEAAQSRIAELEAFQATANADLDALRTQNEELQTSLQTYENQVIEAENSRKENLINKYEKVMQEEEITPIKERMNDFSYDELESKLAIAFANKQMTGGEVKKVPLPEPQESQFALLIKKYRKN